MIVFENIDTGETIAISRKTEGKYYRAKLSAAINSSNMNVNADRGQDFGWRLVPEQQALIEQWEHDPSMIDRVSQWSKVMVDGLTHTEFLAYMLYQQELGNAPESATLDDRRGNQREYEARVEALRSGKVEAMPAFNSNVVRGEETLEDFMDGTLTGDSSGDKVEDEDEPSDLSKKVAEVEVPEHPLPESKSAPKTPKAKK